MTSAPNALHEIRALEERAFNAWPSLQTVVHGDWLLRIAGGFTQRANSVNALHSGAAWSAELLAEAQSVYARHGLPAVFRLTPLAPPEADAALEAAGYERCDASYVLQRPLVSSDFAEEAAAAQASGALHMAPGAGQDWLDGFVQSTQVPRHHHALHHSMVQAIAYPTAFALLRGPQHTPVGFALAVLERGAVGLFDVAVSPSQRGCGRGRQLVAALLHWAAQNGAHSAYLQVAASNSTALRLYEQLGFAPAYAYHYRRRPL